MPPSAAVLHDSHSLTFRSPFGAVECGAQVALRLAVTGDLRSSEVTLRLWLNGREKRVPMSAEGDGLFSAAITVPDIPSLVWYYFVIGTRSGIRYYSNNDAQRGGIGRLDTEPHGSFQITVYRGGFATPPWLTESVMYQVFVDRFSRGPRWRAGERPPLAPDCYYHENWDDQPAMTPLGGQGGIRCNDFFGGDLQGLEERLGYLSDLGVGVLYLNPVFEAASNHKYDTADYLNIDPGFGTTDDFSRLCARAAEVGIRVILDGVFSHTGADSVYFNRDGRFPGRGAAQSKDSPYYSWYRFRHHPDDYEAWWNVDTLPNVDEMNPSFQEFIMGSEGVVPHWLRAGASGWRLDVADELPDEFLKRLRRSVKDAKPDGVLIGEVWEDASNKISYGHLRSFLLGDELDGATNYPFRDHVIRFLLHRESSADLSAALMSQYENYPLPALHAAMNVLGSHDVTRILTVLEEAPNEATLSRPQQAAWEPSAHSKEIGRARVKLASLLLMVSPGVPCIYYGDEVGLEGHRDPLCRRTYPWGREDEDLRAWFRRLARFRNATAALKSGTWRPLCPNEHIYGCVRSTWGGVDALGKPSEPGAIVSLVNRHPTTGFSLSLPQVLVAAGLDVASLTDVLTGEELQTGTALHLNPLQGRLFVAAGKRSAYHDG